MNNQPPQPNSSPPPNRPNKRGLHLKPWPVKDFVVSLLAVGMVFVLVSFLPQGTISSSSVIGGTMAGMTMSYLSYCGYSLMTSPIRTKLVLALVLFGVMILTGGGAAMLLSKSV